MFSGNLSVGGSGTLHVQAGDAARNRKPVRIWMDGCFDLMHYGHMNAFRQGKALGTHLVVGVNSDETITGTQQRDMLLIPSPCLSPSDLAPLLSPPQRARARR